ncbi:hypothetical protein [Photobacterium leiognathi]|uniref:hypothetical protein n=1 Tax=Photobacterium leiognathi TaxID=553611 RepID=UPI0029820736|nr:hypothetical protein [Photobacterium leiognathi]
MISLILAQHLHRMRTDLLNLTIIALFSIFMLLHTFITQNDRSAENPRQSYVAVDFDNKDLHITNVKLPLNEEQEKKLDAWVKENLVACLTMDFSNVNQVISHCINSVFSNSQERVEMKGWSVLGKRTAGGLFYQALEESFLLSMVYDTRSTMTIELTEFERVSEGVYQRKIKYIDPNEPDKTVQETFGRPTYRYVYHATYKFHIVGKRVDIPMEYEIVIDRVSETAREYPVAIRSIRTNE